MPGASARPGPADGLPPPRSGPAPCPAPAARRGRWRRAPGASSPRSAGSSRPVSFRRPPPTGSRGRARGVRPRAGPAGGRAGSPRSRLRSRTAPAGGGRVGRAARHGRVPISARFLVRRSHHHPSRPVNPRRRRAIAWCGARIRRCPQELPMPHGVSGPASRAKGFAGGPGGARFGAFRGAAWRIPARGCPVRC